MKRLLIWWTIGLGLLFLATIGIYIANFHVESISLSSADWGTFGDFIGGVLGPILAIINILVLLYLTFKIANVEEDRNEKIVMLEDQRNEKTLQLEKELAINEIKLNAFKEISNLYLKISIDALENKNFGNAEFLKYKIEFHTLISPYVDLFKTFDNVHRINKIGNTIFEMGKWMENQQLEVGKNNHQINMNNEFIKEYTGLMNDLRQELFTIS